MGRRATAGRGRPRRRGRRASAPRTPLEESRPPAGRRPAGIGAILAGERDRRARPAPYNHAQWQSRTQCARSPALARRVGHGVKARCSRSRTTCCSSWRGLRALFTPPATRARSSAQMDSLGVRSLLHRGPHRDVHGHGAGAAVRGHPRRLRRPALRRPAGVRLDGARAGARAHRADGHRPRRLGHGRRAGLDGGDAADRRAARAGHRSHPQARGPAPGRGRDHGADPDHHLGHRSASSAAASSASSACSSPGSTTGARWAARWS